MDNNMREALMRKLHLHRKLADPVEMNENELHEMPSDETHESSELQMLEDKLGISSGDSEDMAPDNMKDPTDLEARDESKSNDMKAIHPGLSYDAKDSVAHSLMKSHGHGASQLHARAAGKAKEHLHKMKKY